MKSIIIRGCEDNMDGGGMPELDESTRPYRNIEGGIKEVFLGYHILTDRKVNIGVGLTYELAFISLSLCLSGKCTH